MNILVQEHQQLLLSLVNHQVDFMLIGGYAVIHYGYERTTGDMDIWLQLGNENKEKLVTALADFGIEDADIELLQQMDFSNPLPAFFIGETPRRIDFVTMISNLNFEEAAKEVNFFEIEGKNIPVIHYNHLILSKLSSGRMKDKADIEELERINKYRQNKNE